MPVATPKQYAAMLEAGCAGCEEDDHDTSGLPSEKLYTTPEDMVEVYEALQPIVRFLFAETG